MITKDHKRMYSQSMPVAKDSLNCTLEKNPILCCRKTLRSEKHLLYSNLYIMMRATMIPENGRRALRNGDLEWKAVMAETVVVVVVPARVTVDL